MLNQKRSKLNVKIIYLQISIVKNGRNLTLFVRIGHFLFLPLKTVADSDKNWKCPGLFVISPKNCLKVNF